MPWGEVAAHVGAGVLEGVEFAVDVGYGDGPCSDGGGEDRAGAMFFIFNANVKAMATDISLYGFG
jgi:hypothetical protein